MTSRLPDVIAAGDPWDVDEYLRGLSPAERAVDSAWYDGSRRWFTSFIEGLYAGRHDDSLVYRSVDVRWVQALCALALCGPVTAAERVPWDRFWDYMTIDGEAAVVQRLWELDRDWVSSFVEAAARVQLGGNERNSKETLTRVLRAVVLHHGLPVPAGATFHLAWLAPSERGWPNDKNQATELLLPLLRSDPLMPELLYHFLASGHAGIEPGLPGVTALLVDEGVVDRRRVLDAVLEQLTGSQRVASQRVLAGVLASLGLAADEVPGGVPYLSGVIATADGSVGQVLLPLALELVGADHELAELTAVVAGRPERKQKQALLRWLERAPDRLQREWVLDAVRVLGDGDTDADFRDRLAKALADLGSEPPATKPALATGLWDLAPTPGKPATTYWWWAAGADEPTAMRVLSSDFPLSSDGGTLDWGVSALLAGRMPIGCITDAVRTLLAASNLSFPQTTRLFESLFLAGGLKLSWAAALEVAEAACLTLPRPGGLVVLLRMLSTYAPEVPAQELPPGLAALAAAPGTTKAQAHARALGAQLARTPEAAYVAELRARAGRPVVAKPPSLERWAKAPEPYTASLLDSRPLVPLETLANRVDDDNNGFHYGWVGNTKDPHALLIPPLLLDDLARTVAQQGIPMTQQALATLRHPIPWAGPVRLAVQLWAAGVLTVDSFWELAESSRVGSDDEAWEAWQRIWERRLPAHDRKAPSGTGLPRLADTVGRVLFLTACETLLLLGSGTAPLSTPAYDDGTLDLDHLVARLRDAPDGSVGPLDLVQALYRLRPVTPTRVEDVTGWTRTTAPALTSPSGDTSTDAVEAVRRWVAAGGLPELQWQQDDTWRRWTVEVDPPVTWDECRAAPSDVVTAAAEHPSLATAMLLPQWPDLYAAHGLRLLPVVPGTVGLRLHDALLQALSGTDTDARSIAVDAMVGLARQGRLQPEAALAAAARLFAEGTGLSRAVPAWQALLESDGFSLAWRTALAVADAAAASTPRPAGLAALLQLLVQYAHEVPGHQVAQGIRALADEPGKSKSHVEARRLVQLLAKERT